MKHFAICCLCLASVLAFKINAALADSEGAKTTVSSHSPIWVSDVHGPETDGYILSVKTDKNIYSQEGVNLTITLKNAGKGSVRLERGSELTMYDIDLTLPNKEKAPLTYFGKNIMALSGDVGICTFPLKPGESYSITFVLNRFYDMNFPGLYKLSVSGIERKHKAPSETVKVYSNSLEIRIDP